MARNEELRLRLTADDKASKTVDELAGKVGKLEDDEHEIELKADDKATSEVKALDKRLERLTDEERVAVLKAEGKQLEREVDSAIKKLSNLDRYDDDEIALILDAKDKASAKLQDVRTELGKVEDAAEDAGDEIGDIGDKVDTSKFQGVGGSMGGQLLAGFGAAGIGALISKGVSDAMDINAGLKRLEGQFRISADDAAKYGQIAGELYAANWGESLVEVQRNVALTAQRLGDITLEELASIAEGSQAVTDTFGEDYEAVIRSISQLLENGLAGSATEALDLVTAAFQAGGNEAGDLLDTIDEYSQHWSALGLSGEEALNQVIHGLQNGQRDTDKLADATKEFRLRAVDDVDQVSEAYAGLGLDADDYRNKILAGGESARGAFLEIVNAIKDVDDPIEQNKIAVALLGTQYEDLGPKALDSLLMIEGGMGDVQTATEDLTASIEETPWEKWQRRAETALVSVGQGVLGMLDSYEDIYRSVPLSVKLTDLQVQAFDRTLLDGLSTFGEVHQAVLGYTGDVDAANLIALEWNESHKELLKALADKQIEDTGRQTDEYVAALEAAGDETKRVEDATKRAKDENKRQYQALGDLNDEYDDLTGYLYATVTGTDDLTSSFRELRGEITQRGAYRDLKDQFDAVKVAAEEAYIAAAEGSDDAESKSRDHQQAVDEMILGVIDYGAELDNLPDKVTAEIVALIDQGKLDEAEALIEWTARQRDVQLRLRVSGQTITDGGDVIGQRGGAKAGGGPMFSGKVHEFAENGPELYQSGGKTWVVGKDGASARPAEEVGGGGGHTFVTNIDGNVYGVDHLQQILNERDRKLVAQLRQGRRG